MRMCVRVCVCLHCEAVCVCVCGNTLRDTLKGTLRRHGDMLALTCSIAWYGTVHIMVNGALSQHEEGRVDVNRGFELCGRLQGQSQGELRVAV